MSNDQEKKRLKILLRSAFCTALLLSAACGSLNGKMDNYRDANMDFGSIRTLAVMPLANFSRDPGAGERTRDVIANMLLATGSVYVLPAGEVSRGIARAGIAAQTNPSIEEIRKLGGIVQANAVIIGTIKEYEEVRAGSTSANVISLSLQMIETQTGKIVWAASTTQGGITPLDRLLGGGGKPMNDVTEKAVYDLLQKLFK